MGRAENSAKRSCVVRSHAARILPAAARSASAKAIRPTPSSAAIAARRCRLISGTEVARPAGRLRQAAPLRRKQGPNFRLQEGPQTSPWDESLVLPNLRPQLLRARRIETLHGGGRPTGQQLRRHIAGQSLLQQAQFQVTNLPGAQGSPARAVGRRSLGLSRCMARAPGHATQGSAIQSPICHQLGSKARTSRRAKRSSSRWMTPRSSVVRITRPAACTTFCRPG